MRILVCNDDGIESPGLAVLEEIAKRISSDVWTVAPDGKRTAASASLTIGRPLTLRKVSERRYAFSGTPADCVVAAIAWLFKDGPVPDLVLGGINDGRNVAEDRIYSGTLGIAREATFWGIPAIGFSRVKKAEVSAADVGFLANLVEELWRSRERWSAGRHFLSVNLPARLPAPVGQPRIGRDKIGCKAEVISQDGDTTTLVFPRGRPGSSTEGDENELIDAGYLCINSLDWMGEIRLDPDLLVAVERSLT